MMQYINKKHRRLLLKYNRSMEERRVFMQELKKIRAESDKDCRKEIKENIGPTWYQVLTITHRTALDTLSRSIYQDRIEGRPVRTMRVIRILGIIPRPNKMVVQHCMVLGRDDPKEFLAHLFYTLYKHPVSGKRYYYNLNMRIILSSIFYLGLDDLIRQLKEQFKPDKPVPSTPSVLQKKRASIHSSPYMQKMVAPLYRPALPKRKPQPPLPDLSFLNKRFSEEGLLETPMIPKPPPPPPPPPPPKKRIPRSQCDKLAGIIPITQIFPKKSQLQKPVVIKKPSSYRRLLRSSKMNSFSDFKKKYGVNSVRGRKKKHRKPKAPSTGLANVQYMIIGVYTHKENTYYIVGTVCTLPPQGIFIHGGHALLPNGEHGTIMMGFSHGQPSTEPEPCDCLEKWETAAFRYIENTKCYCGHRYDFGNEGTFTEDDLPFFVKPTRTAPLFFNYDTIYQMDEKLLQIQKEAKRIWDNESILQEEGDPEVAERSRKKKKKKEILKIPVETKKCLSEKPDVEDYLRCGLRFLGRINVAARLPDVHLAPELRAWMRLRVYGPYTTEQKEKMLKTSMAYWSYFKTIQRMGLGKVKLPSDPSLSERTTWKYKPEINKQFKKVVHDYQIEMYKAQAYTNNLLWATTYDAEYPDKNFREIYFTYLPGKVEDVVLYHPYCRYETAERSLKIELKRYICLAKGSQDVNIKKI